MWPRAAFSISDPRSQFFTIRTFQPANNISIMWLHLTRIGNRVVHAGKILSIIVIHEHQALRQHNSKKNSRKYVKVSKIAFCTFLKLEFLIPCGEICVTNDCPRLHHRKPTWPCGVTGSLRIDHKFLWFIS